MINNLLFRSREIYEFVKHFDITLDSDLESLCQGISNVFLSNTIVIDKKGKIIISEQFNQNISIIKLDNHIVEEFNNISNVLLNYETLGENFCVCPIIAYNKRIATLIIYRNKIKYDSSDEVLLNMISSILSLIISSKEKAISTYDNNIKKRVKSALQSLSYSELEAVISIFKELSKTEGIIIGAKIAEKYSLTRSVIANGIKKLESAGLIETRSLGTKGTYIKVSDTHLLSELKNYN